jgi:hypothetical protein
MQTGRRRDGTFNAVYTSLHLFRWAATYSMNSLDATLKPPLPSIRSSIPQLDTRLRMRPSRATARVTLALRNTLTGIQRGTFADTHGGWIARLG